MGDFADRRAPLAAMMYDMTYGQHQLVYNFTSFTLASMMATTMFVWIRMWGVKEELRTAMCITGMVTFIAFYHYIRIFNSWVDAYKFPDQATGEDAAPTLTGIPFNDACRYSSWSSCSSWTCRRRRSSATPPSSAPSPAS